MKDAFLMIIKIIFAVLLVPVCYALTVSFIHHIPLLQENRYYLVWGGVVYVLLQLFFYTPQGIFQIGQKIFGGIFKTVPILAAVIPLFVPIIPTVVLVSLYVCIAFFDYYQAKECLVFFGGFTFAMHLILSAHAEFEEDNNGLKPHYLFLLSLTYLCNLVIFSLLLNLNFPEFSFTNIFMSAVAIAKDIYLNVYIQLFAMN